MVQKNRKWNEGLLIRIKKLEENVDVKQFKKYAQVNLVKMVYTRWFTEQKECIHIQALSQEEKCVQVGKSRFWSEVLV